MRILIITPLYPGYSTQSPIEATHVVHHIAREWAKKHDVQVIRLWPYYPKVFYLGKKAKKLRRHTFEENFILDRVKVFRVPLTKIPKYAYLDKEIFRVVELIKKKIYPMEGPDIVICDTLEPSIYIGKLVAQEFNSILVASLHNTDIKYLSKKKNYKKFIKIDSNINKIVFRSTVVEKDFLNLYTGSKKADDGYFKILFGLDKINFITNKKLEHKIVEAKKEIMVAASLKKLKKIDILIKAFADMENKSNYILRIIGDGPELKTLKDLSKSLNCEDQIIFEGKKTRQEVLILMEQAEIFAMVSSPETFGLVYIEAMAKGCITIGSRNEGIDGVIEHNKNGFLCEPGDVGDLRNTLDKIASMSILDKQRIIYSAFKTATYFDNEDLASKYINKIQENN